MPWNRDPDLLSSLKDWKVPASDLDLHDKHVNHYATAAPSCVMKKQYNKWNKIIQDFKKVYMRFFFFGLVYSSDWGRIILS